MLDSVVQYIRQEKQRGFSDEQIKDVLLSVKYKPELVEEAFKEFYTQHKTKKKPLIEHFEESSLGKWIKKSRGLMIATLIVIVIVLAFVFTMIVFEDFPEKTPKQEPEQTSKNDVIEQKYIENIETLKAIEDTIDINDQKSYKEIKEDIQNAIDEGKIEDKGNYADNYDNYKKYKLLKLAEDIEDVRQNMISTDKNDFNKTIQEYKEKVEEEKELEVKAIRAAVRGKIEAGETTKETVDNYVEYVEEIEQEAQEAAVLLKKEFEEETFVPSEELYNQDCVLDMKKKESACLAAAKKDLSECWMEEYDMNVEGCHKGVGILLASKEDDNSICFQSDKDWENYCMAIIDSNPSSCNGIKDSAECLIVVGMKDYIKNNGKAACEEYFGDYKDLCAIIVEYDESLCLESFDIEACKIAS